MLEVSSQQDVRNLITENLNADKVDKSDCRGFIRRKIKVFMLTCDFLSQVSSYFRQHKLSVNSSKEKQCLEKRKK